MTKTVVGWAAKAAIGLFVVGFVLSLACLYLAFRLTTWPIRKVRPRQAARTAAIVGFAQALFVLAAAVKASESSSSLPASSPGSDTTYTGTEPTPNATSSGYTPIDSLR